MLHKLKKHWEVNSKDLILILCTFAITGTITAWLSKKVAEWLLLDKYGFAWWTKVLVLIFGYQVIILIIGFCFGMFPFFWKYEKKILKRFGLMKKKTTDKRQPTTDHRPPMAGKPINLAIFASGAGSNAQKIIDYFKGIPKIKIRLIVCNNPKAGVLSIAAKENIPVLLIDKNKFFETGYVQEMKNQATDFIALAGFLWKIPPVLINAFQKRIINIHPALLPAYGGKGMYGNAVHSAVIASKDKKSGISIHYVDEKYDHGKIIFQATCDIDQNETAESLAQKIHQLEHDNYSKTIERILNTLNP